MRKIKIPALLLAIVLLVSLSAGCSKNNDADTSSQGGADAVASEAGDDYEEGTSEADNIVNAAPADKVLLVLSFGTSFNRSRSLTIGGIEAALQAAYPDYQVRRAFTSQIIIDKLASREGLVIDNVEDAMNRLVLDKVKEVVIQPTTVMSGFEYDDIISEVMPFADKFESFKIGKNLLYDDADYDAVAEAIVNEAAEFRADGTDIVFMGHGTEHASNGTYAKLQGVLNAKGCDDYIIGTVEAEPSLEDVQALLTEKGAKKVVLRPLMIVAGDHANNDMAGDEEDSWKTVLTEAGYDVVTVIEGLGQIKAIQDIFINHVRDAIDSDDLAATPTATAVGAGAERIRNGTYAIEADSSSSMFKIVDCKLTVDDKTMTAEMTMSGTGFDMIYPGALEQAQGDEAGAYKPVLDKDRNVYTMPVAALDRGIACAGHGVKSGDWFDHILTFKSAGIPADAFIPCRIDVSVSGGSGKAGIDSPAALLYRDGANIAQIVWSSPNYTYMSIGGEKYLPTNAEGNSTFEIPVKLDTDMRVVACTTAMSEPKEIEYVLHFDSASIE
jgi:sirohydrochlorin cobaltochelatase